MISNILPHENNSITSTLVEVQLPAPKDSNRSLFSKIARSPTTARRHRPVPSQGSDEIGPDLAGLKPQSNSHHPPRQTATTLVTPLLSPRPPTQDGFSATRKLTKVNNNTNTNPLPHIARAPTRSSSTATTATNMSAPIVSEVPLPYQMQTTNVPGQPSINYLHAHIQELSHKRIATLDYLRRSHEGKIFYFNTMHLSKIDISRIQSYTPNRLSRRATNYFLLGLSIPAVLDQHPLPHSSASAHSLSVFALEYLRDLNALLTEFETYQTYHPTDGSHVSSLSRARLPSMFRRSGTTTRPRRSSSGIQSEVGSSISPPAVPEAVSMQQRDYLHGSSVSIDTNNTSFSSTSSTAPTLVSNSTSRRPAQPPFATAATYPPPAPPESQNSTTLPSEPLYTHLLTPPLPFSPDFTTVFATLCDLLIGIYSLLLQTLQSPTTVSPPLAEVFSKTDARIRKVIVAGIVKDFEGAVRENARSEISGVQRVVIGGLAG